MIRARLLRLPACLLALASMATAHGHGVGVPAVLASEGIEWLGSNPAITGAWGGRLVGNYFYVNDHDKLTIFDVSNPELPVPVGVLPFPVDRAAEDIDTNGMILLLPGILREFGEEIDGSGDPAGDLAVVDVSDKTNPRILSTLEDGGGHTVSCVADCTWAYASDDKIIDLRDPARPSVDGWGWWSLYGVHDLEEVAPGRVMASDGQLYDSTYPWAPRPIAHGVLSDPAAFEGRAYGHSVRWPRSGADRFLLITDETFMQRRCGGRAGDFWVFDTTGWESSRRFTRTDRVTLENGTLALDGKPPANVAGCSYHWLEPHPRFADGGLVAAAAYEHGVRFLEVGGDGKVREIGWFVGPGSEASAAYWITDEIVYVIDAVRGLDVLRLARAAT